MKAIIIENEKLVAKELSMKIADIDADLQICEIYPVLKLP